MGEISNNVNYMSNDYEVASIIPGEREISNDINYMNNDYEVASIIPMRER